MYFFFFFLVFFYKWSKHSLTNSRQHWSCIELGAIWRIPWIARMVKLEILEMEKKEGQLFSRFYADRARLNIFFLFFCHYYIFGSFLFLLFFFFYIFLFVIISDIMHGRNYSFKICNETLTHCVQYFLIVWFCKTIIIFADKDKN